MTGVTASLLLDAFLLLLFALYAVDGFRRGLVRTVLGTIGFVAGGALGFRFMPDVVRRLAPEASEFVILGILAGGILLLALIGQGLVVGLARSVVDRTHGPGPVDRVLGAVVTLALAVGIAWLAAGLVRVAIPGDVSRVVGESRVLAAVDEVVPVTSADVLDDAHELFSRYDFPRVFEGVQAEPIRPVEDADPGATQTDAITAAGRSVVRIDARAPECGRMQEGSGFVVAPGLVVTNAHVVAGSSSVAVRKDRLRTTGEMVAFDADRDLAVIAVDTGDLAPLPLADSDLDSGDDAVVAGFPLGGPFQVDAARVRDSLAARGRDIYGEESVVRRIYALRASIHPGNSGGPMLTSTGEVAGVIFARSLDDESTAYALRLSELRPVLDAAADRTPLEATRCAA